MSSIFVSHLRFIFTFLSELEDFWDMTVYSLIFQYFPYRPVPDNTQHSRQTSMLPVGIEPTVPAS